MGIKRYKCMQMIILTAFLCMIFMITPVSAQNSDEVSFSLAPYLWLPSIGGELQFTPSAASSGGPEIGVDPDDYFSNLEMALLFTAQVRVDSWSLVGDFIYMDVSGSGSNVKNFDFGNDAISTTLNINSDLDMKTFVTSMAVGYQVVDNGWLKMDLVAGVRYLWLEAELKSNFSGTVTGPGGGEESFSGTTDYKGDKDFWNGIGGIRGSILFGNSNWFAPFYADIGAGDSDLTYQLFAGIGYEFSHWFNMVVGYRYLDFENDDDSPVKELDMGGPIVGFDFLF